MLDQEQIRYLKRVVKADLDYMTDKKATSEIGHNIAVKYRKDVLKKLELMCR